MKLAFKLIKFFMQVILIGLGHYFRFTFVTFSLFLLLMSIFLTILYFNIISEWIFSFYIFVIILFVWGIFFVNLNIVGQTATCRVVLNVFIDVFRAFINYLLLTFVYFFPQYFLLFFI